MAALAVTAILAVVAVVVAFGQGGVDDATAVTTTQQPPPAPPPPPPRRPGGRARTTVPRSGGVSIRQGVVGLGEVRVYRSGTILVITCAPDESALIVAEVFDTRGAPLGNRELRRPYPGPASLIVRLSRNPPLVRLRLTAFPTKGPLTPTVVSIARSPVRPHFEILSPKDGATVHGSAVRVRIGVRNFTITDQGTRAKATEGHFHVALDKRSYIVLYGTRITLGHLDPGEHTLVVTAHLNNHLPLPYVKNRFVVHFRTTGSS
jgi:hypothetical protein